MKKSQFSLGSLFWAMLAIGVMLAVLLAVDHFMAKRYEKITGYPPRGRFGWMVDQYAATP